MLSQAKVCSKVPHTSGNGLPLGAESNKGSLAEQFVGQQLRFAQTPANDPQLFYRQRTGGRLGEIDYIIQHGARVVPVEVKSGSAGSMKSLHQFMAEKNLDLAVRCNLNLPSVGKISVKTTLGKHVTYRLISMPEYLAELLAELIEQAQVIS